MADIALRKFGRALTGANRVGVDTPGLIYHLQDVLPYSQLTDYLFEQAGAGLVQIVISTIVLSEILVGPWRAGDSEAARRIEEGLKAAPGIVAADVTWDVAGKGAALRGRTNLPLPDALIIASSVASGVELLITNDAAWRRKDLPCRVLVLDDYVTPA